ncbi:hypothetical protein M413DRAFT_446822 [Hebeloma cylindrosporum]|uniref:Uncharacterized protein n=1 Tax=Hebeloma cylindrosporum TaxID=76867 RepID=A0A0C2YFQ8_HEBCY|nr:hypothetical protein M413DRAFT_446822 [Hebeloma cylindrosporum h7]
MPTATTTFTKASFAAQLPLKAGLKSSSHLSSTPTSPTAQSSTNATLRSLYNRAARAFVYRDIALTYSLLQSAFAILKPPKTTPDFLSDQRRKWDILRITLESTLYTSPPSSTETLPESLRSILSESPQALATSIYSRSLSLFTPNSGIAQKATSNAAYLPSPVLTTLVYSSLKIDAPDVGRVVIEDWLACREPIYSVVPHESEGDGYAKVLDLYCLQVLPKLEQWDYAKEFLEYESELPTQHRENLKTSLNIHYSQAMASRRSYNSTPALLSAPTPVSPRSYSPAPSSSSSSSSSLSTTSTHTIVPATPRGNRSSTSPLTYLPQASSSSTSISSNETATPRATHASLIPNGNPRSPRQQSKSRTLSTTSSGYSSLPRSHLAHQVSAQANPPSTYALIRASLAPYLTSARVTTFVLLFVLVPLLSIVLRMRRKKRLLGLGGATMAAAGAATSSSNAELVRRRLQTAGGGVEVGFLNKAWAEVIRVVGDTVRMAGSGLV